jgi:cholesterol transport system auxiliary component
MNTMDPTRRRGLQLLLVAPVAVVTGGCGGRGAGESPTWWELDVAPSQRRADPDPARSALSLVVEGTSAGSLYDGTALLFSRQPGMRSPYQYANWVERPPNRIARLAQRGLLVRGGFRDVSAAESGIRPDLLLTLTLEGFQYNQVAEPAVFEAMISASLMDWRSRRLMASARFSAGEPASGTGLSAVVAAAGRATARVLDELSPWVEGRAAGFRR